MANTKNNSGSSRSTSSSRPFKETHRVIASRGMSFPAMLLHIEGPVATYLDLDGTVQTCHRSEIVSVKRGESE